MFAKIIPFLPPLIVFCIALATQHVALSLIGGIITAGFIASNYEIIPTITLCFTQFLKEINIPFMNQEFTSYDHLYALGFLSTLGMLIQCIISSGGIHAYVTFVSAKISKKKSAETMSLILSLFFFIDDYVSNLIMGAVMRPISSKLLIARAKIAFLIDSMSGTLCLLIPTSSWVAFILLQLKESGLSVETSALIFANPFTIYLHTIPYLFYPLLIFISSWIIVIKKIEYGPMRESEHIAYTTGNLWDGKQSSEIMNHAPLYNNIVCMKQESLYTFFVPIITFLFSIPIFLISSAGWHPFQNHIVWYKALSQTSNMMQSLWLASTFSFFITTFIIHIPPKTFLRTCVDGWKNISNSLLILLLAWTFSSLLQEHIQTGKYLAQYAINAPLPILPVLFFIISTILTSFTGSSWGTLAILPPIIIPFLAKFSVLTPATPESIMFFYPIMGAIFSGTVAGGHFSPLTDTTVMAATSAGYNLIDHVKTQIPYALPAFIWSFIGFLIIPLLSFIPSAVFFILFLIICGTILMLKTLNKKKS